jgi:hypothetical protein
MLEKVYVRPSFHSVCNALFPLLVSRKFKPHLKYCQVGCAKR